MPRHLIAAAVGHNANRSIGDVPQQRGVRFLHVEDNREVIRSVEMIEKAKGCRFRATNLSSKQGIESPLHVARGQRASVVEFHASMQMKNIGERVGNLPALGQAGGNVEVVTAREQVVEDQIVDAFRLRVEPHTRVEIGGTRFNDHDQCVGVGAAGAGKQWEERDKGEGRKERGLRSVCASCAILAHLMNRVHGFPIARGGALQQTPLQRIVSQAAVRESIWEIEIHLLAETARPIWLGGKSR